MIPAFAVLTGCGDPLAGIDRVSQGATLPDPSGTNALPTEEELARGNTILTDLLSVDDTPQAAGDPDTPSTLDDVDAIVVADTQAETPARRGVLGWLRRAADAERSSAPDDAAPVVLEQDGDTVLASLPADISPDAPQARGGLFSNARVASRDGPDARDVVPGTILPFGEIARVCDARGRDLGQRVDSAARKGTGYDLFDTAPGSATARTFYITGFDDNCPRQFTAALALFGSPEFHEQLRYGLPADEHPYSTTDQAYEKVKARVCNVGRNTPCGPRIARLERTTAFLSVYENFGENSRWSEMLLHEGAVLATALKTR